MASSEAGAFDSVTSQAALKQGIIASALGLAGVVARLVISPDRQSWSSIIRSGVAAAITAYFVNLGCKSYVPNEEMRVCVCGIAGFASPEILNHTLAFIDAKLKGKVAEAQAGAKRAGKGMKKKGKARGR